MKKLRNVFVALLSVFMCASFCLAFSVLIPVSAESTLKIGTTVIEEGGIYVAATDDGAGSSTSEKATTRVVDKVLSAPSTDYFIYQSGEITVYGNVTLKSKSQNIFELTETNLTLNGETNSSLTLVTEEASAIFCDTGSNSQITLKGDLDFLINNYSKKFNAVNLQDSSLLTEAGYSGNITVNTLYAYENEESNILISLKNGNLSLKTTGDITFNSLSTAPALHAEISSSNTFLLEANNVSINGWVNVADGGEVTINAQNDITVKYDSQSFYNSCPLFSTNKVSLTANGDVTLVNNYIIFSGQATIKNAENLSVAFEGKGFAQSPSPLCLGTVTVDNCKNVSFLGKDGNVGSIFIGGLTATDCDNVSVVSNSNDYLSIGAINIKQTKNKGEKVIIRGGSKNNLLTPNSITVENYSSVQLRNNDLRGKLSPSSPSVVDCDEVSTYCVNDEGTPQISTTSNGTTAYSYPLALVTYADGSEVFCDTVESGLQLAKESVGATLKVFVDSIDAFDVLSGENYAVDFSDCTVNGTITVKKGAIFGIKGGSFQTLNIEEETTLNISGGTFETLSVPTSAKVNLSDKAIINTEITVAVGSTLKVSGSASIKKLTDNGANIKLSGGMFEELVTSDYASILEDGYCYFDSHSNRLALSEVTVSSVYMVTKCYSHERINGICKYCNAPCDHYDFGEDLVCTACGESVVATITSSDKVVNNYLSLQDALNAVTDNCTLKLLKNTDGFVVSSGKFTLDATNRVINGKITVQSDADLTIVGGTLTCPVTTTTILNMGKLTLNNVNSERAFMSRRNSEIYINGGSFSRVILYNIAYGKFSSGNISAIQFDDKTLNLNIVGGTYNAIYLDSGMTLKDILADGYSFTQGDGTDRWVDNSVSGHVEGVTYNVEKSPIQSFYIDGNAEITYKDDASLTAVTVLADGYSSVSYSWTEGEAYLGNNQTLYLNSSEVNCGTHTFTCVANCDGYIVTANFELTVNPINIEEVAVVSIPDYFKTGESILANPSVKVNGTTLVAEQDYTVSGDLSGTESGTYNIVISGTGNYSGTIEKEWKIVTPVVSSEVSGTTKQYASIAQALSDGVDNMKLLCDLAIEESITVTDQLIFDLNGYVLTYSKPFTPNSVFVVSNSSTLTLIDSRPTATHTDISLPLGGTITGGTGNAGASRYSLGGGVCVQDGTFIMEGGNIFYCSASIGGGVYVQDGVFVMKGGTISQCSANLEGSAIFVEEASSFTMNGGEISGSSSTPNSDVVKLIGKMFADGGVVNGLVEVRENGKILHGSGEKDFTSFFGDIEGVGTVSGGLFYGTISSDITLEGKKVTFVNGESTWAILLLNENETAIQPLTPEDERILTGWYNGDTPHVFSLGITQDLTLKAKWAVTKETVDRLRADMETAKNELSSAISSGDSDLSQSINTLNGKITQLEQALAQSNVKDDELQDSIDSARQVLQSAIDALGERLSSAESEISSVKDRLSSTESELDSTKDRLSSTESELNSTKDRLSSTENKLNSTNEEVKSIKTAFIIVACILGVALIGLMAYVVIVKGRKS